jgi:hypothetical protein
MTAQQQNALNAAQIAGDAVRRNLVWALQREPTNQAIINLIQASDTARQAAGQTIEYSPDALFQSGAIPGTAGLTTTTVHGVPVKNTTTVAPPGKNA